MSHPPESLSNKLLPPKRFQQSGAVECGPAVVCAVLSQFPSYSDQLSIPKVISAAGIEDTINTQGSNVIDLTTAVNKITNGKLHLYFKRHGSVKEIDELTSQGIPVVVDWQGSTLSTSAFEGQEGELGHYTVVTKVDTESGVIHMIDSVPGFPNGRVVPISEFEEKWWDVDTITSNGVEQNVRSDKMFFVIVPTGTVTKYNLSPGENYLD